jgi:hypothetical protein
MTLDASGNLGVGVTPSAWESTCKILDLGTLGCVGRGSSGQTILGYNFYINSSNNRIYKATTSASQYEMVGAEHRWYTAPSGTAGNPITFTQAMTLDSSGNLLVGHTSLDGYSYTVSTGNNCYTVTGHSSSSSGTAYAYFNYSSGTIGSITQNGTTAVAYNTSSDYRLKNNVRPADAKRFMDIQFRDFEWVDGRHDCGVIAHELQAVYPDLITGEKDAVDADGKPVYQQVNYTGLICRMGAVIQQLEARLAALENK